MIKLHVKIVDCFWLLTIFDKNFIKDVWQGPKYVSGISEKKSELG